MKSKKALFTIFISIIALFSGIIMAACDNTPKVTLTFETNCTLSIDASEVKAGSEYDLPSIERGGWSFEGWYDNAEFQGNALSSIIVPDKNTTYYAKWIQMHLVTFDTDGGILFTDAAYVKPGENLLEALSSYTPQKEGLSFGGWFFSESNEQVSTDYKMPEETVRLFARYHVAYTAELYTKDLEGDGYTLEKVVEGKDFVNERLLLEAPELEHFIFDESAENNVKEIKLQLSSEKNIFRFYYNRGIGYTIVYNANTPQGFTADGNTPETVLLYGEKPVAAVCGFSVPTHRFAGWSKDPNGTAEYSEGSTLDITADLVLYAVWERGYTDRLGGVDIIYLPEAEEGVALLERGGIECRGTIVGDSAFFRPDDGSELIAILSFPLHSFTWKNDALAGTYYAFYGYYFPETDSVGQISENEILIVDEDLSAVYHYRNGEQETTLKGIIRAEAEGFSLVEGDTVLFTFRFGTVEDGTKETPVFYTVGKEAGEYLLYIPVGNQVFIGTPYLYLDGMGGLIYNANSSSPIQGYYHIDKTYNSGTLSGKIYTAVLQNGNDFEEFCFMTYETGYDPYLLWYARNDVAYGTFTNDAGDELSLDGYGVFANSATYTVGNNLYEGSFEVNNSEIFGTIVTVTSTDNHTFTFRLAEGNSFEITQPSGAVAEMFHLVQGPNGSSIESVILVTYDTEKESGRLAEVYVVADGPAKRAAIGYYTSEDLGGIELFTFTCTERSDNDLAKYLFFENTFKFLTSDDLTVGGESIVVYYVYEHDGVRNYTLYKEKDGTGYIWQNNVGISGMGSLYVKDGIALEGSFDITGVGFYENQNFATFTYADRTSRTDRTLYFLIETDESGNTYRYADFPSRTLVNCPVTGADNLDAYSSPYSLILDGVGGAIYAPGGDASVSDQSKLVKGRYSATDETEFGDIVYTYYPDENSLGVESFDFVMGFHQDSFYGLDIIVGMYIYHKRDVTGPSGNYYSPYGYLVLDGFCNQASFTEADGTEHRGTYYYQNTSGSTLYFYDTEQSVGYAIDFTDESNFTVRDGMQGAYSLFDDNYQRYDSKNYTIILDGYGGAVLNLNGREAGRGTYSPTDIYYVYRLDFELRAGGNVSYQVAFMSANSTVICIVQNVAVSGAYLADNWTVLVLDGFGRGTLIDEFGIEHVGLYSLIGSQEGAFEYSDGTGGFRFSYDMVNGSFAYNSTYFNEPLVYYASDLSSIVYNGMYAIYNGIPYYFNLNGDDVTLFTGEGSEELHVKLPSGPTYSYNDKIYYRYTVGTEMTFENADEEIEIFLNLSFTPTGDYDFVAFEVPAIFGSDTSGFTVAIGYGDSGAWESYLYDLEYGFELQITLNWDPNGKSTYEFITPITETMESYADSTAEGGLLTFYYYAVGSTLIQGRVVGTLNYGTDTKGNHFAFEVDLSSMETIKSYETELGVFNLSQILFTAEDGNLYAVRFFLGSITTDMMDKETWYTLDSIAICKEFKVTDESGLSYLVRTYQHVYAYPEYTEGYEWGVLYDCDLYLSIADEDENYLFLTPRFYYVASDESYIAWGVRFSDGSYLGFMINLTYGNDKLVASATVTTAFYGQFADEDETYFVEVCYDYNLSLKEFEILGITVFAKWDDETQSWMQVEAEFEKDEDGLWTAITEDGVYKITVSLEQDLVTGGYYALLHISFIPASAENDGETSE